MLNQKDFLVGVSEWFSWFYSYGMFIFKQFYSRNAIVVFRMRPVIHTFPGFSHHPCLYFHLCVFLCLFKAEKLPGMQLSSSLSLYVFPLSSHSCQPTKFLLLFSVRFPGLKTILHILERNGEIQWDDNGFIPFKTNLSLRQDDCWSGDFFLFFLFVGRAVHNTFHLCVKEFFCKNFHECSQLLPSYSCYLSSFGVSLLWMFKMISTIVINTFKY